MTPEEIRDANFDDLRARLPELRAAVLNLLHAHGPCTTRELAERTGRDLLSIRPRITELVQFGLVILEGRRDHEGIYRAATREQWLTWQSQQLETITTGQLQMC